MHRSRTDAGAMLVLPHVLMVVAAAVLLTELRQVHASAPAPAPAPVSPPVAPPNPEPTSCNLTSTECGFFQNPFNPTTRRFMRCPDAASVGNCIKASSPTIFVRLFRNQTYGTSTLPVWSFTDPLTFESLVFYPDGSAGVLYKSGVTLSECSSASDVFGLSNCTHGLTLSFTEFGTGNPAPSCKAYTQVRVDPPLVITTLSPAPCLYSVQHRWIWTPACCPAAASAPPAGVLP